MWRRLLCIAAPGVFLLSAASAMEAPTFNDEVVRILQTRCQTCHRPGEHAPFSLLTYRDAYQRRDDIRDAVRDRVMPPWKPVPGFGDFVEPRRLSDAELTTLVMPKTVWSLKLTLRSQFDGSGEPEAGPKPLLPS